MITEVPVVVCGAGPAGSATAIRLRQLGIEVLLIEKSRFPRPKLCGEFLGPMGIEALSSLGLLDLVVSQANQPLRQATFHFYRGRSRVFPLAWLNPRFPFGIGISREKLDSLLCQAACQLGAMVFENTRIHSQIQVEDGQFQLEASQSGSTSEAISISTSILVDAGGRHSGITLEQRQLKSSPSYGSDDWVGVKLHVRPETDCNELIMGFFPGGYGGFLPLQDGTANLCQLLRSGLAAPLKTQLPMVFLGNTLGQNPVMAKLLAGAEPLEAFQTTARMNWQLPPTDENEIIRVGDAMVTVEPLTGSGMGMALQSGILAAEAIADGLRHKQPYNRIRQDYENRYRQRFSRRIHLLNRLRPVWSNPLFQQWGSLCPIPLVRQLAVAVR